jgi:hypothetical protein
MSIVLSLEAMLLIFRMCSLTPLSKEYLYVTSLLMMVILHVFEELINGLSTFLRYSLAVS